MSSVAFATKERNVLVSHRIVLTTFYQAGRMKCFPNIWLFVFTPKEEISDSSHFLLLFNLND